MGRFVNPNLLLSASSLDYQPEDGQLPQTSCSSRDSKCVCIPVIFQDSKAHQTNLNPSAAPQAFWLLVDGFYMWACFLLRISPFRCVLSHFLIYSWEFLSTLDLEWNVIRGHRPHRWTIWVSSHSPFFFLFYCYTSVANSLIFSPGRSIPLPDWPLSHL